MKVLSAGTKFYNIKMYFDYDAYRFSKLMRVDNGFSNVNVLANDYEFLHKDVALNGASNILRFFALGVCGNFLILLLTSLY